MDEIQGFSTNAGDDERVRLPTELVREIIETAARANDAFWNDADETRLRVEMRGLDTLLSEVRALVRWTA